LMKKIQSLPLDRIAEVEELEKEIQAEIRKVIG